MDAAPSSFRTLVGRFIEQYLGTTDQPVPFGGRDQEIEFLNNWLANKDSPGNLLITAPAGRGKTALLIHWIDQLDTDWEIAFVPISIRYETNRAPVFFQALAARLAQILGEPLPPTPPSDPAVFYKDKVIEYIDRFSNTNQKCLIVIDGLDEAGGWHVDTTVLPPRVPSGLKVVVSARLLAGDTDSSNWLSRLGWTDTGTPVSILSVSPLKRGGIADVLRKMAVPLDRLAENVDIIGQLYRLTERGDPLLLTLYIKDLLKEGQAAAHLKPEDLAGLKPGFGAYFKNWFTQQEKAWRETGTPIDTNLVNALLAVLACALGPLSLAELDAVVGRVHPSPHIFSSNTVRPIGRFVIGDGSETGYALAHPKLAEYIRQDRFGGGSVISRTERAFIEWGREIVQMLNDGRLTPGEVPVYAVLHYTQHLEKWTEPDIIHLYRELLEDGWRQAWEAYEGGMQGFSRDVELTLAYFRKAAVSDPRTLKEARIGFGGQIRCVLILSSIRSIGLGVSAKILRDFVENNVISLKQAIHLIALKDDDTLAEALVALGPMLTADLFEDALGIICAINDVDKKINALANFARSLAGPARQRVYEEAIRAASGIQNLMARYKALINLSYFVKEPLKSKILSEASGVRDQAEFKDKAEEPDNVSYREEIPSADDSRLTEIINRSKSLQLSPDQLAQVLAEAIDSKNERVIAESIIAMAPKLTEDLLAEALEHIWSIKGAYDFNRTFAALVSRLPATLLDKAMADIDRADGAYLKINSVKLLAPYLSLPQIEKALIDVQKTESIYIREKRYGALIKHLPPDRVAEQFRALSDGKINVEPAVALSAMAELLPDVLVSEALEFARIVIGGKDRSKALIALVPRLSPDLLTSALATASDIMDMKERGEVLIALLPRMREAGRSADLSEAYQVAFAIGDDGARAAALAVSLPELPDRENNWVREDILNVSRSIRIELDQIDLLSRTLALVLLPLKPDAPGSESILLGALDTIQGGQHIEVRPLILTLLASRLPSNRITAIVADIITGIDLIKNREDRALMLGIFGFLLPREVEAERILEKIHGIMTEIDQSPKKRWLPLLVTALVIQGSDEQVVTAFHRAAAIIEQLKENDRADALFLAGMVACLLTPPLPKKETRRLLLKVIEEFKVGEDADIRAASLCLFARILPTADIIDLLNPIMMLAARSSRPTVFAFLAFAQGAIFELVRSNPRLPYKDYPQNPLMRIGGPLAVRETAEAIRDVCRWWP